MRQRLGIFIGLALLGFVLIALNAATYVQQEKVPDSESRPNRSSYNSGATGTQAFYTLLAETGRNVTRWREPMDALKSRRDKPAVFVIVGDVRRPFDDVEAGHLLAWVHDGGRLVLVDRTPEEKILDALPQWGIVAKTNELELLYGIDPYDPKQMLADMPASRPVQPSLLTSGVNAVQTSRFASHLEFSTKSGDGEAEAGDDSAPISFYESSTPTMQNNTPSPPYGVAVASHAPVALMSAGGRNVLVDIAYGGGTITILSDPYVVSNVGIGHVDNVQLAVNLVGGRDGTIAFDEYHQGYGATENRFFQYFAGTPVISIFIQLAAIAGFVLYSQSRRFGRPVPEPEPDRGTKLEYVAAMAELQQRTKAYDLALENIYSDFRRRVCRSFGVDNRTTTRRQLAALIAERVKGDANEIEGVMYACEDIAHGADVKGKAALEAAARLRQLEDRLGLSRGRSAEVAA